MSFHFLDQGELVDRELRLAPALSQHIDLAMAALSHPLMRADPRSPGISRRQIENFLRKAPNGRQPADPVTGAVPSYHFFMWLGRAPCPPWPTWGSGDPPFLIGGGLGLRIADTPDIRMYLGHIGYNVHPPVRGNRFAERSVRLVLPLAQQHGLETLWITCNPDNEASRRTCERLGCDLVEIVELPPDHPLRQRGEHHKCRFRLDVARALAAGGAS
jgi:tagatose 1,6-diphosphate aldolase